jgi:hypothetical protein
MARKRNQSNGRVDESLEAMKQAQTQMLQALATILARMAGADAEIADLRRRGN